LPARIKDIGDKLLHAGASLSWRYIALAHLSRHPNFNPTAGDLGHHPLNYRTSREFKGSSEMTTCFSETQRFQLCVLNIGQVKLKINGGIEREQYSAQLNFLVE